MKILKRLVFWAFCVGIFFIPGGAYAQNLIDALNLSPFVPLVLDSLMMVATGGYEFFVGENGGGIIYLLIWGFFILTVGLYLVKMYFPKEWVSFFGFSGGGEIKDGKINAFDLVQNSVMKPALRVIIATTILLQIKPMYLTEWLVNPFLQFGAAYTHAITETINEAGTSAPQVKCPADIVEKAWISESSCNFLIQPVSDLSHANNQVIKKGFDFLMQGLRGLITLIPHGGEDFLNVVTGTLLILAFVGSNIFMALLVIQGIFNFGMALILYPFQVLTYVFKSSDKWLDIWPAFSGITKALQQLIVTMIACAFTLCVNLAVIKALFRWNSSVFVVAAGGTAVSNVPQMANTGMGFGSHSVTWLSAILTFYIMYKIFNMTQDQLQKYVGSGMDDLYKQVKRDSTIAWTDVRDMTSKVAKAIGWIKKK